MDWIVTTEEILEHVDEYTLYSHYLGFEPELRMKYRSPIRKDDEHPSFSVFDSKFKYNPAAGIKREYMWKDNGSGNSGDIFELVRLLYGYKSKAEAAWRIRQEFLMQITPEERAKLLRESPPPPLPAKISVRSKPFDTADIRYWNQFGIEFPQLRKYFVSRIGLYWLVEGQQNPSFPKSTGYAYNIYNRYQLYFPHEERHRKFRHDLDDRYVLGYQQLEFKSDTLIITKSYKDIMCLDSFGYEAVSPRSENTPIDQRFLDYFQDKYRYIYILFDNDGKHRRDFYPDFYSSIEVPKAEGQKDISDFRKLNGAKATHDLLKSLIPCRIL